VLEEFFMQGDMEKNEGLPVSPMCDRATVSVPMSQINFIEFVVAPLMFQVTLCLLTVALATLSRPAPQVFCKARAGFYLKFLQLSGLFTLTLGISTCGLALGPCRWRSSS
jgi:3'5'-cyclic nucleotide phosphodiesterase